MIKFGADPNSPAFSERPLEVSKDKFARAILQNLNDAAYQANVKDIKHLVNCGNKIDCKTSIFGEAPIHKAVLTKTIEKNMALKIIIEAKQIWTISTQMDGLLYTMLHIMVTSHQLKFCSKIMQL